MSFLTLNSGNDKSEGSCKSFKFGKTVDKRIGLCVSSFYPVINLAVTLEYFWDTCSFMRFSISCQVPIARKLVIKGLGLQQVTVFPVYCNDSSLKSDSQ